MGDIKAGIYKLITCVVLFSVLLSFTSCNSKDNMNEKSGEPKYTDEGFIEIVKPSVEMKEESILLKNSRLKVELMQPGKGYRHSRFDWSGIVKQVTLDDAHTYCADLDIEDGSHVYGLMGSFTDANINPDLLDKSDEDIAPFLPKITYDDTSVTFTKEVSNVNNMSYKLVKTIKIDENVLTIKQTLTNTGSKRLTTSEYNHNFMIIDNKEVGPDYKVEYSFAPEANRYADHLKSDLIQVKENSISLSDKLGEANFDNTFFADLSGWDKKKSDGEWWKLTHTPSGVSVKVTDDFAETRWWFWGRSDTICNETFITISLKPDESKTWIRTYEFEG